MKVLWQRICRAPPLSNAKAARARLADLAAGARIHAPELAVLLRRRAPGDLLAGIADHSPYLWRLAAANPVRLERLMCAAPEASLERNLALLQADCDAAAAEADLMHALRLAKQEVALLVALADIGGIWDVVAVTEALTRFADCVVSAALGFLLRHAAAEGKLDLADPEVGAGVVVLAFGKHGARELNYSSDIDLVVFFDPAAPIGPAGGEPIELFVRMTKALVRLLQERTRDGYVLRVDLRLRPDPGSTSVAISLPAAFSYYETVGQNWERAALIKARPIAGDIALGRRFLADLSAFIWRKYFDYAAIADIHAMKRQIHAVRGHAEIAVEGHDVKLGRGGIREIEFFVQTQQLIFGGRRRQLRGARTLDMLVELADDGWITAEARDDLRAAYLYLRTIEHRLQMIADEQTQRLPPDAEHLARFARFCGYAQATDFAADLTGHLQRVEKHYALLFEHAPGLDAAAGNLVFTGTADDPDTIDTLAKLGFHDPSKAAETVRGWHFGHHRAIQSARAREVLTELVPALLQAFASSGDADAALAAFDMALARMPAAVELLSILKSNPPVRELFGDILGGAPRLANIIALRPHVLDAAIDPALLKASGDEAYYDRRCGHILQTARRTEEFLDAVRDMAQEEAFLIGLRTLSATLTPVAAGRAYSALAASLVRATLAHVQTVFSADHGNVPGGCCAVVALGRLGSRAMTAASDLDLILLYDFDEPRPESDGARPLHALQYYTRLTQRLISALTVATRRGQLYEVDMRLRPSGRKGPVATQFRAFVDYQRNAAETWEHMALTRARVIGGDGPLMAMATQAIGDILRLERNPEKLRRDAFEMRALIAQEKGDDDPWDLKLAAGGIIDVEFIAQVLTLRHGARHPDLIDTDMAATLAHAVRLDLIGRDEGEGLIAAYRLYAAVMQMIRLTSIGAFDPATAAAGVKRRIAAAAEMPDFAHLERTIIETRAEVREIFLAVLGSPLPLGEG